MNVAGNIQAIGTALTDVIDLHVLDKLKNYRANG